MNVKPILQDNGKLVWLVQCEDAMGYADEFGSYYFSTQTPPLGCVTITKAIAE